MAVNISFRYSNINMQKILNNAWIRAGCRLNESDSSCIQHNKTSALTTAQIRLIKWYIVVDIRFK